MNYSIVTFPQKKVQDWANSLRKRYDPQYCYIPPHITLKEKFELSDETFEKTVESLERVAKEVREFHVKFNKVSHFYPITNTIYLAIKDKEPLVELHDRINELFEPVKPAHQFVPHLTIGQEMSDDELHDIYGRLRMKEIELETGIDRFHLMYELENGSWSIFQSFLLAKD
ncbi:2'-5' RNA ligase family protein [Thermoactinomyces mirandus]|uniref:Putative phosphoesterase H2C83_14240 n=1 Tax=Thermoactinomyces mirandus TaxID=2756294 RepID=A0A7W1XUD9_9BACL|nr:2'-5' RNA ligase family protein [Thermoactinomyces mirandus]MBA4603446.1 2'-5' RNA ligase family protein [Thermoactinomyces mirandus]